LSAGFDVLMSLLGGGGVGSGEKGDKCVVFGAECIWAGIAVLVSFSTASRSEPHLFDRVIDMLQTLRFMCAAAYSDVMECGLQLGLESRFLRAYLQACVQHLHAAPRSQLLASVRSISDLQYVRAMIETFSER
jgi:hypothetical protein